ncbi:MAG: O-antigen ligase family protein [Propionibacteriaceae bacterium]|nr:O-antigen ligase family protein [Propionibacteriaceae bacterium]
MRRLLSHFGWPERAAVLLLMVWVVWAGVATALVGRILLPTSPYVVAPVALAVGVVLGRLVAPQASHRATGLTLLALSALVLLPVLGSYGAAKAPLFYANANAALAVQLMALCGLVMVRTTGRQRAMVAVGAVLALAAVAANYSKAGFAVAVPAFVVVVATAWWPARRRWVPIVAAFVGLITVTSAAMTIAALARHEGWPEWALIAFDPARQTMWQDAIGLWERHPVLGAGTGTFQQVSRLGYDADTAAAHSSVLQIGAETGWVGVALFAGIVIAGLAWACRGTPENAVIGVAAWSALLVHSFADHLLEFVPVMLAAGLVLGWSGSQPRASALLDVSVEQSPATR